MPTRLEFATALKERGATLEQARNAYTLYRERGGTFSDEAPPTPQIVEKERISPEALKEAAWGYKTPRAPLTPNQVKDRSTESENQIGALTKGTDEHYASIANAEFFYRQFNLNEEQATTQEKVIGQTLYGDSRLSSYQINSLLQQDIQQGTFGRRAQLAKWKQYGVDETIAEQIDDIYHSTWTDSVAHYLGAAPAGMTKAFLGLVRGLGDTIGSETPLSDKLIEGIEKEQKYYLDDALIRGNYADYLSGTGAKTVGDVAGNLWLMGKAIKAANAWTGGKMSLTAKGKTWKELAKSTAQRSLFLSGLNYVKTPGTPKQKFESSMLTLAYMNTPVVSSLAGTNAQAFLGDFILNSGISGAWNPEKGEFEFGGQYKQAWEDAKEMAEETGANPHVIMVANSMPILGTDLAFSALTRSIKSQNNLPAMKQFTEAMRVIEGDGVLAVDKMEGALKAKYGEGWKSSMSDADRIRYNSVRTVHNATKSGQVDPAMLGERPDKSRVQVVEDRVYFRDADGELRQVRVDEKPVAEKTEAEPEKAVDEKEIVLDKEGEALVEQSFKTIFSQSKKARSKAFGEATQTIKDFRKLAKGLPLKDRAKLYGKVQKIINAKTDETKEKYRAELDTAVSEALDVVERNQIIKNITREPPQAFDFEYRRSIQNIQDSLLVGLNKKKAAEVQNAAEYVAQNPDAQMPDRILKHIQKTPLEKLSTEELRVLSDEVGRLREQGKLKFKLAQKQRKKALGETQADMMGRFKKPSKLTLKRAKQEQVEGKKRKRPSIKYIADRPWTFFDKLDGGQAKYDGPAHRTFVDNVNRAEVEKLANQDARTKGFERLVGSIGERMKNFGAKMDVAGQTLTLEQIAGIYAISKNRLGYNALVHGNFKDADGDAIIAKVNEIVEGNPNLKMAADYILYDFATNADRVFDAVGGAEGKLLVPEEFYIPLERDGDMSKSSMDDVQKQVMQRQELIKQAPKDSFKISRKSIPEEHQTPVNTNLFSLWERHVSLQEHYINHIKNVQDMRSIASNDKFRTELRKSYGDSAVEYLDGYIDVVANPMSVYGHKSGEVISRALRRNLATAYLAGNVKTMIKQSPSMLFYLGETNPKYLMDSLSETMGAFDKDGRNAVLDFVAEKDPLVKHSHMQRELAELQLTDKAKYEQIMSKVNELGFKGIVEVDRFARSAGWYATYKYGKEVLGLSEDAAVERARNATLRTQPTASAKDLPPLYRTNEGLNWLLMFSNQLNQIWNMQTKDVPRLVKSGQVGKAMSRQAGLALSAMMMWSINNGKPLPENEEELAEVFTDQFAASIPAVGSQVVSGMKGYSGTNPIADTFRRGGKMFVKLQSGEEVEAAEYYDMFFRGVGPMVGFPTVAAERVIKAAKTGNLGELTGIKKRD